MERSNPKKASVVGEYMTKNGGRITCAAISGNSYSLYCTGDDNKSVSIWTSKAQMPIKVLEGHNSEITTVLFSKDESRVFAGTAGGSIVVWDLSTQQITLSLKEHMSTCNCLAIPNATSAPYLASGSKDANAKIWDLRVGKSFTTFRDNDSPVNSVAFAPSDQWISAGFNNGNIKVILY